MKERISQWPYLWVFFLGGAALPLIWLLSWQLFLTAFPSVRLGIRIGQIIDSTHFGFYLFFVAPIQAVRGAALGLASELFFHANLAKSPWARPLAVVCGAIGVFLFAPSLWADWPVMVGNRNDSPAFYHAVERAFFDIIPLMWSASLLFLGICARSK